MSKQTSASGVLPLPDAPNLEWLRKQAKRRLEELRQSNAAARLADAHLDLAKQYGFSSWRALKAHVDSLTVDGRLFAAGRTGDAGELAALLDEHPNKLTARTKPYEMTLLHVAAQNGRLATVDLLLRRGLDVNGRERGDNTYALHWAAAAGHIEVVQRLIEAGGDVVGHGDDHELDVIGWATCWDHCDDAAHRAIVELLVSRGARHHIFSAIAMNLADEVRRIVAANPSTLAARMSRNENCQRPLHFAVRRNRPLMVALLLELGADPLGTDDAGYTPAIYATKPDVDRTVMEAIRARGNLDLLAALALGDWDAAARLLPNDQGVGALPIMAKRNDVPAVAWLLEREVDPNALWAHWDAEVTALHLAALHGHAEVVRLLLEHGADPHTRDSKHGGDAMGWARHAGQLEVLRILDGYGS